jgi:hypothetical protein
LREAVSFVERKQNVTHPGSNVANSSVVEQNLQDGGIIQIRPAKEPHGIFIPIDF